MTFRFKPLPAPGDILWCKFPHQLGMPGPKPRPALVLNIIPNEHAVLVVYGTTQKIDRIYPGEFVIGPKLDGWEVSGLLRETKFDLSRSVTVPFTTDWFNVAPGIFKKSPPPKMGIIPPLAIPALQKAYKAIK
ncbi:type II toxin-antitoxin system PemK/MazF family toxin [Brenneria populi subsp. brevivirga]|uniref:type II toxin-antitoxin system PemK/MazF family toxin n=1 Tax=Brenneria populi TaxID=1505588 RepID=UPI002E187595|nr:type II toxin-antitoxin system PemK/MazF family toxin [Brenneria populi subsp. brevivirga]